MNLPKKEIIYLILTILTGGIFTLYIAYQLNLYDEDAWYSDYKKWMLGVFLFIIPILPMFIIFVIQINCKVAAHLNVPGSEIYNLPYSWILCVIVPVIGWSLFLVMYIYVVIWSNVKRIQNKYQNLINEKEDSE